ncbi:MAG: peptide transporter permease, partial [Acidimicrobiaceae bacterium]|nr:peptide transporter permease [Acidimicrobiaceae bacterium]
MSLELPPLTPGETALVRGDVGPSEVEPEPSAGLWRLVLRAFVENKLAVVGAVIIVLMILFCFLGPIFYSTNQTNSQEALLNSTQNSPPGGPNPLGTDGNGFDILGRIMFGGQTSLTVGFAAAAMATVVGVRWGAIAGFFGRSVDAV